MDMSTRTAEREQFYADLITTAIEGGIGYWSQTSQYQWTDDGQVRRCVGALVPDTTDTRATIHVINDEEDGYEAEGVEITTDTIAKAFGILRRAEVREDTRPQSYYHGKQRTYNAETGEDMYLSGTYRARLLAMYNDFEDADFDADDADNIVQIGLFGKVVYG